MIIMPTIGFRSKPFKNKKKEIQRLKKARTLLKVVNKIRIFPEARKEARKKLPLINKKLKRLGSK